MLGTPTPYFVHESVVVDPPCRIGDGTKIWHFSHVMPDCDIGSSCIIGQGVHIGRACRIGNRVKVQNGVSVYTGVTVEDDVFLGPSMVFTNVINPRAFIERKAEFRPTLVKRGASIGANATIVCGITLGEYCLVGAGAVVTRDVPAFATVYGNPARQHGWTCWCGVQLAVDAGHSEAAPREIVCTSCGRRYALAGAVLSALES